MTKRQATPKVNAKPTATESMMTVQLDDLDLGRASKPAKTKPATKNKQVDSVELLDEVSKLLEKNKALETSRNMAVDHVDAAAKQIEKLTERISSSANCDCDATVDKVNELDARLNSLQNAVKKQSKRGDKIESSMLLIDELGNKIESLSDQIKLAAIESEVTEDYSEQFLSVNDKLTALYQIMEGQAVDADTAAKRAKQADKIEEKVDVLAQVVKESAKEAQKKSEASKSIDSLTEKMVSMGDALKESIQQNATPPIEIPNYSKNFDQLADSFSNEIGKQVDSLSELLLTQASEEPKPEIDFSKEFENLAENITQNFDSQIASVRESVQRLDNIESKAAVDTQQLADLSQKLESIQQSILEQPSAEPSLEQKDYTEKLDELTLQIATMHELFGETLLTNSSSEHSSHEQLLQRFESFQDSLVDRLQSAQNGDSADSNQAVIDKLNALQDHMSKQAPAKVVENEAHTEQLSQLAEKVEGISQLIAARNANETESFENSTDHSEQLRELSDRLDSTQSKIDRLVESIGPLVDSLAQGKFAQANLTDSTEVAGVEESAWEKQKRELLAGYGAEPGADSEAICGEPELESPDGERGEWINEDQNNDDVQEPQPETTEVLALKSELEEKLRRAEIEISIERAKLHREKHQIEQQQLDIEQKMAKIRSASENEGSEAEGRWSRFLGKKGDE